MKITLTKHPQVKTWTGVTISARTNYIMAYGTWESRLNTEMRKDAVVLAGGALLRLL